MGIVRLAAHLRPNAEVSGSLKRDVGFSGTLGAKTAVSADTGFDVRSLLDRKPGERITLPGGVTIVILEKEGDDG